MPAARAGRWGCLSRQPHLPALAAGTADDDAQVLSTEALGMDMSLLELEPESTVSEYNPHGFSKEQKRDDEICAMIQYLRMYKRKLSEAMADACRIAIQAPMFTVIDGILYYLDEKQLGIKRIVVPKHLRRQIMQDYSSIMAGHFSGV